LSRLFLVSLVVQPELSSDQKMVLMLAALLHDADDRKYFGDEASMKLSNAREIAFAACQRQDIVESMAECIGLVSCSKNKNSVVAEHWRLLPRFCDRLEAIGWPGVVRCFNYNQHVGTRPLFTANTPRVTSEAELEKVAPHSRFMSYSGDSESFIDHFYDKLVHVCQVETENEYLTEQAKLRKQELLDYLFEFGRTGDVDVKRFHQ
jgi:hypothetical protein